MRYWVTTHWPHPEPDDHPWHVYLKAEFKEIADMFAPGDRVLFYESKYHRPMADGKRRPVGAEGVVVAGTVAAPAQTRPPALAVADYADGTCDNWLWGVPTRDLDTSGYVPRRELNEVLEYKPTYNLHGFGVQNSGVKELTEQQYNDLLGKFRRGRRPGR
jgi:hypothetical protein